MWEHDDFIESLWTIWHVIRIWCPYGLPSELIVMHTWPSDLSVAAPDIVLYKGAGWKLFCIKGWAIMWAARYVPPISHKISTWFCIKRWVFRRTATYEWHIPQIGTWFCFTLLCCGYILSSMDSWGYSPISFRVASLALGQLSDCPSASDNPAGYG